MFQLSDILPGRSPPQQTKLQRPQEESKTIDPTEEAVVTGSPAGKNAESVKTSKDKFNDEISYTLMSNCNLRPSRVFTVTPVEKVETEHDMNLNKDVNKHRVIRRTSSGLPTVSISGHSNNDLKNKMFLRNDTSPVLLKTKNTNASDSAKKVLTKTLSSSSFRQQPNVNNTTGKVLPANSSAKHCSALGRSNTEIKLTKPSQQLSKPFPQTSSIVVHPSMGRMNTQDCFTELMKNNSLTMPAGAAQFFIRNPETTNLARSNTETSLLDDSLEDLNANSLNRNSGMRVLGYIWTFWNKGQQNPSPPVTTGNSSTSNDIIRIPPGRTLRTNLT